MKKLSLLIVPVLLVCIGALGVLFACKGKTTNEYSKQDLLALSTASALNLLATTQTSAEVNKGLALAGNGFGSEDPSEEQINQINDYVTMIEGLIGKNNVSSVEGTSEVEGYAKKLTVTFNDLNGNPTTYVVHYNETLQADDDDDDDDEKEQEQEFSITGIMVAGDLTYSVIGEKELEEGELEFSFKASIDDQNYIKFKQEIEKDEQEFQYTVVEDGVTTSKFALEIEDDQIKFKSLDASGLEVKFSKHTEKRKTFLKGEVVENGTVTRFQVTSEIDEESGKEIFRYKFSSGKELTKFKK